METMIDCTICRTHLADLLLEPGYLAAHPEYATHMSACAECSTEWKELQAAFSALDSWTAPEPSAYFDTRLKARLREAAAAQPEGFWERARAWFQFSTGRSFRPVLAGALSLVVLISGAGGALVMFHQQENDHPVSSTAVNDLKILDNNAQALQQMDQLLDTDDDGATDAPTT
ncbi:MAG: hypothetical protein PW735_12720 [Acidobacteriaceae bacterium]|nr:hypothetical protein [Acidobacteriaceae bacterium]